MVAVDTEQDETPYIDMDDDSQNELLILTWMTMDIMILIQIIHLMKMLWIFELEKDNMLSQLSELL